MQLLHRYLSPKACLLVAAGFTVLLSGCADSHDKVARDILKNVRQFNDVLETVKDTESAEKAKPKLEKLEQNSQANLQRWEELGQPSTEVAQQLIEKYRDDLQKEGQRTAAIFDNAFQNPAILSAM